MKDCTNIKEHIIQVTIALIEEGDGDINRITARMIAKQADIGLGLINYHFGSKDKLITICVQRIIEKVVAGYHEDQSFETDKERLTAWATHVFEFLFEHPAISKISILGDFHHYDIISNSVNTQKALALALKETNQEKDKAFIVFVLTAAMQVAFLGNDTVKALLGFDFTVVADRDTYIKRLVALLFEELTEKRGDI